MGLLDLDARWRRFNDENRICPCCGQSFNGIFDIGFDHPDLWPHGGREEAGIETLVVGEDKLSADLCRLKEHRFIRCVMPFPLQGSDEIFQFGIWASIHPDRFYAYIDHAIGEAPDFEGCFAWLMNTLQPFDHGAEVACDLRPGGDGQRPTLMAQDGVLADAQANGISFDQLLDIYAAHGTDMRPHLQQD